MITVKGNNYEMRKLGLKDVFAASKILKKIDLKVDYENIANVFKTSGNHAEFTNQALGMELFYKVLNNLGDAEQEFYEFLASLYDLDKKVIEELDLDALEGIIEDLKNQPNLGKFLRSAGQLMKSKR